MLRIPCPYCGLRDQVEFRCGGEASVERPARPDAVGDAEWAGYLFYRDNLKGRQVERWVHTFGCRQWFLLTRETLTHEILGAYGLDENCPDLASPETPP